MPRLCAAWLIVVAAVAFADDGVPGGLGTSADSRPAWEFAVTAYPTMVRGGENYTSADCHRRPRPAAPRGPVQLRVHRRTLGVRRLELLRRRNRDLGADATARRRVGGDPGVRARIRGEPGLEAPRLLRRGRIRARQRRRTTTATSMRGPSWATRRWSGCASGSPASARGRMAATATSSAGRSRSSRSARSRSAATGSIQGRTNRSLSVRSA